MPVPWHECVWRTLFPPRCAGCGLWCAELFCETCFGELEAVCAPHCKLCGAPFDQLAQVLSSSLCADCHDNRYQSTPPLAAIRSPYAYSRGMRKAIRDFKYHGKTARAPQLATVLGEYLVRSESAKIFPLEKLKLIVPVPLHRWRRWRRGYNQSTLLSRDLTRWLRLQTDCDIPVREILQRVRYTRPQVELSGREREQNIHDAFALDEVAWQEFSMNNDDALLLLDDVTTTGATLLECARVLRITTGLKPEQIYALTLTRPGIS
jgi:ComF family protein